MTTTLIGADTNQSAMWLLGNNSASLVSFSPFGSNPRASDAQGNIPGFNGERRDPTTLTTHLGNGYRAYSPILNRFTCPDDESPFGEGGINAYVYCDSDPINQTDPSGRGPKKRPESDHQAVHAAIALFHTVFREAFAGINGIMRATLGVADFVTAPAVRPKINMTMEEQRRALDAWYASQPTPPVRHVIATQLMPNGTFNEYGLFSMFGKPKGNEKVGPMLLVHGTPKGTHVGFFPGTTTPAERKNLDAPTVRFDAQGTVDFFSDAPITLKQYAERGHTIRLVSCHVHFGTFAEDLATLIDGPVETYYGGKFGAPTPMLERDGFEAIQSFDYPLKAGESPSRARKIHLPRRPVPTRIEEI